MVNEMDNGRQGTKPKPATPASLSHFDRIAQSVANAAAYGPSNASIEASLEVDTVTKAKDKASAGKLGATPQHCRCYKKKKKTKKKKKKAKWGTGQGKNKRQEINEKKKKKLGKKTKREGKKEEDHSEGKQTRG